MAPLALPDLPSRSILWKVAGFFALLAVLIYGASVLRDSLVLWDDNYLITYNPHIKSLSFSNIAYNFTHFDPELYIPLTFLSYQIDHLLAGMSPAMFHFTNLVLHWLNACLVGLLLFFLTRNARMSILCGLLFLAHPLNVESVAWASARKDVLSTFFFLASSALYLKHRDSGGWKSYWLSIGAFFFGLLSKVMIVTLPVALVLFDIAQGRKFSWRMILDKLPYLALSTVFGIVALFGKAEMVDNTTALEKILMAFKSTFFYLEKFFVPINLSLLYPYNQPIVFSSPDFYIPVIVVTLLVIGALLSLRWTRWIFVGVAFFLVTLAPTFINFAKGGDVYFASDRYAYLPSFGLLLLIAWAATRLIGEELTGASRRIAGRWTAAFGTIILTFSLFSYAQTEHWKDSEALLTHAVSLYPEAFAGHVNLSVLYRTEDRDEEAMEELKLAQAIRSDTRIESGKATIYAKHGRTAEAYAAYRKAIELDPDDTEPYFGLGILYAKEGKTADAIESYRKALALDPTYTSVRLNLASLYLERKEYEQAAEQYRALIDNDPTVTDAYFNLGVIAQDAGRTEEAVGFFEKVTQLDANAIDAYTHLAELYLKLNKPDDAVRAVKEANRINPLNDDARFLLETFRKHGLIQ